MLRGIFKLSVDNPVMANILTVAIIIAGIYSAFAIIRDLLPETKTSAVVITTKYPGGAPEDIETGVTEKIEDAIEDTDGIDRIFSVTTEGLSRVTAELKSDADVDRATDDIKAYVDNIEDMPEEAEEPTRLCAGRHVHR